MDTMSYVERSKAWQKQSATTHDFNTNISASPSYSQVVSEIKRHLNKDDCVHFPKPFLGQTVRQVYSFFKNHLRRPEDKVYDPAPFTHFTFLAVDAECVRPSEPLRPLPEGTPFPTDSSYSILVCTDAPDWNECGPQARMKTLRLPISAVFEHLLGLEELTTTPSEIYNCIFDSNGTVLKLFPPPTHLPVATFTMDENQKYTTGTPAQMRLYKSNGLRLEEHRQRRESTGEER
ncbi:MAG: hypothetical protein L6R39_004129 [Caloplaca ligustica]|nr:MAG: hypothetical protein L6R39_004129 [Caloplaca ligustica]